jgi:hypothetical protein
MRQGSRFCKRLYLHYTLSYVQDQIPNITIINLKFRFERQPLDEDVYRNDLWQRIPLFLGGAAPANRTSPLNYLSLGAIPNILKNSTSATHEPMRLSRRPPKWTYVPAQYILYFTPHCIQNRSDLSPTVPWPSFPCLLFIIALAKLSAGGFSDIDGTRRRHAGRLVACFQVACSLLHCIRAIALSRGDPPCYSV